VHKIIKSEFISLIGIIHKEGIKHHHLPQIPHLRTEIDIPNSIFQAKVTRPVATAVLISTRYILPGAYVPACHETGTKHHKQGTIRITLQNSPRRVLKYSKKY